MPEPVNTPIGYIVGGGLKANLNARLTVPPETVQEGAFVIVDSGQWRYYGLVTDILLGATDPRFADEQSEKRFLPHLSSLLHGQTLFTNLEIMPSLMLDRGPEPGTLEYEKWSTEHPEETRGVVPVKTVPAHHSHVNLAQAGDIAEIFGEEGKDGNFRIGSTREQGHPVCVNLDKLVQRSSGIFGATGTGKSFLTRIILAGLIQRDQASVLIFDMHSEYGPDDTSSDTGKVVPGLKSKFSNKIRMVGLGKGTSVRGQQPDYNLEIAESDIQPGDIEMLTRELNLKETTPTTLEALTGTFRGNWFSEFKKMRVGAVEEDPETGRRVPATDSVAAWANDAGINAMAAEGLRGKMGRLYNRPYIVSQPAMDTLGEIIKHLEAGQHVVLTFGENEKDLDYLLVTNLLTRKIREAWEVKTNAFRSSGKGEPRPLVVAVEEAHRLLNREMATQTSFSQIAREMRKYYVTLLIIDQRPSQIYDEVMSQLGTRISGWLGDEADIAAVLSGLAGRDALRGMLARLQPKEEVLLLGWGVPMPIPVRSRRYGDAFWKELLGRGVKEKSDDELLKGLGF